MMMKAFDIVVITVTLTAGFRFLTGILTEVWRQCLVNKLKSLDPNDYQAFYQLQTQPRPWYIKINRAFERWERRVIS